jgi:hypothetical protein
MCGVWMARLHKRKQDDERMGIVRANGQPLMLAVTPTRELAEQLVNEMRALAQHLSPSLNVLEVYGGADNQFQVRLPLFSLSPFTARLRSSRLASAWNAPAQCR